MFERYIYIQIFFKKFNNPAGQKDARLEMKNWRNWMKIAGWNQLADGVMVKYMNNAICVNSKIIELFFRDNLLTTSKFFEVSCGRLIGELF